MVTVSPDGEEHEFNRGAKPGCIKLFELPLSISALTLTLLTRTERSELWEDVEDRVKEDKVRADSFVEPLPAAEDLQTELKCPFLPHL